MLETSNNNDLLKTYDRVRASITTWLGVILTVVGVAVVFIVASLEGTKEIKASSGLSTKILELWRTESGVTDGFPEERGITITFNNKEYYFVVKSYKDNVTLIKDDDGLVIDSVTETVIDKWYFAYDGGIEYIFSDAKFYILTIFTIIISLYVSNVNYISTVRTITETEKFKLTLGYYQQQKQRIEGLTQYIPDYCNYKNEQAYNIAKREVIEDAGINYLLYNSPDFDASKLQPWQVKKLKQIKKIKVTKIHSSDLLQEQGYISTKIKMLPISQQEHQKSFMVKGFFTKTITSLLGGMVVAFGVVLGNWFLGIAYGISVLISFISAIVIATDFASTTLRNRFIAKGDLLGEFYNIQEQFKTPK